jgi:hypothetical protein
MIARVADAPRRRPGRWWRWIRRIFLLLIGLVVLLLVGAGIAVWMNWSAVTATRDAVHQIDALENYKGALQGVPAPSDVQEIDHHLGQLRSDLHTVSASWAGWRGAALLVSQARPSLHRELTQVDGLLAYAGVTTQAGQLLTSSLAPFVSQVQSGPGKQDMPKVVAELAADRPVLRQASVLISQALVLRRSIVTDGLPAQVQHGLSLMDEILPNAPTTLNELAALPEILGADGPRTYLLVPENNQDLRATGGFIGTVAELQVNHGKLSLVRVSDSYAVDEARGFRVNVPPPLPMAVHGWSNWIFPDANWSADFPTTAQLLETFYRIGTLRTVNGVIAITPPMVRTLLNLTGPVALPAYHETLTPAEGFARIDYEINDPRGVGKKFAAAAYTAIFKQLLALPHLLSNQTLQTFRHNIDTRQLLVYANDGPAEQAISALGASGAIDQVGGDYLYVVDTNLSTNKINQLIDERISYQAKVHADRGITATLTLRYTNTATTANVPVRYGTPFYSEFLRVFVPRGSVLVSSSGLDQAWGTAVVHNRTQFSGYFQLDTAQSTTISFTYRIPPAAGPGPAYHLLVQKQPGSAALPLTVAVSGAPGVSIGGTATVRTTLNTDVSVTAPPAGGASPALGPSAPAPEPPFTPGSHPEIWVQVPTGSAPLLR